MTVGSDSGQLALAAPSNFTDEAGTPPEDRKFRPDIQGLRALAVLLVVLYHAQLSAISGGFVGVDVFYVISGFVITGVLLRERAGSGRTSLLSFYGRRCRRIIPAVTLVIVTTVVASYVVLGALYGYQTAIDGRWAAVFLVNLHFAAEGTNYLSSQLPPSPLQNLWSLSVEEQFYVVYPTLFLLVAALWKRVALRVRLAVGLSAVIVVSYVVSVVQTSSNPTVAFFSPWTRAWELALGGLVAVGAQWLLRLPAALATLMTWVGLVAIVVSALVFNSQTPYPGSLVAIPVVGTALVIAGGTKAPRRGAESILGLAPFGWLGNLSYSLYLWHWPILILAAESQQRSQLPFTQNLPWLVVALVASVISYRLLENPVRHSRTFMRSARNSVGLGIALIVVTLIVTTVLIQTQGGAAGTPPQAVPAYSEAAVARLVESSPSIRQLPSNLTPSLATASSDFGAPPGHCTPTDNQISIPSCVFGDPKGSHTMVLYGDSHALMWFRAMDAIALSAHWRLVMLGKGYCMANHYERKNTLGHLIPAVCMRWQRFAYARIKRLDPDLVVVTQEVQRIIPGVNGKSYTPAQWQEALQQTFAALKGQRTKFAVIGNIPNLGFDPPTCLSQHTTDVQACTRPVHPRNGFNDAERRAVASVGGRYINVTPWFCSSLCTSVVGRYVVYVNQLHITGTYSMALRKVLAEQLDLAAYGR